MSGIMNKLLNHKKVLALLFLLLAVIVALIVIRMYLPAVIIIVVFIVNELIVKKMNKQKAPFGTYSKIRNVDCLVIGDITSKSAKILLENRNTVSIFLPGCSLEGAYEVLRHTFSILKEDGGKVMLVIKKKNIDKAGYSPFEISFFHPITIIKLKLNKSKYMLKMPFLFAPIKSLTFLFGICTFKSVHSEYQVEDITMFCKERGFECKILKG